MECDSLTSFDFTKPSIGNRVNAVDLGLPSGTEWADCNVGADKPEEYGGYYAWGETNEKKVYDMENCLLGDCDDQYSISVILDDAASIKIKFGWKWQMPTRDQIAELVTYCTYDWVTINGTKGGRFTGPNGNSIFLPAAGGRFKSELYHACEYGFYWSGDGSNLFFDMDDADILKSFGYYGFMIRPVAAQ